jgi:hypothetical protein
MDDLLIYLKLHHTEKGTIIAMCDENLIGKVLKDKELEIDLNKYSVFYKGDLVNKEKAASMIKVSSFFSANIVGKESVDVFENSFEFDKGSVRKIGDVPFLHVFKLE